VPTEPRKRRQLPADGGQAEPTSIEASAGRRRRNTTATPRARAGQLVDFAGAAQRSADRTERVKRLQAHVREGAYRADPLETARAMERRSDG
jgi:anti-sigma28 factor (negative regulator of flagellin synthesis)